MKQKRIHSTPFHEGCWTEGVSHQDDLASFSSCFEFSWAHMGKMAAHLFKIRVGEIKIQGLRFELSSLFSGLARDALKGPQELRPGHWQLGSWPHHSPAGTLPVLASISPSVKWDIQASLAGFWEGLRKLFTHAESLRKHTRFTENLVTAVTMQRLTVGPRTGGERTT